MKIIKIYNCCSRYFVVLCLVVVSVTWSDECLSAESEGPMLEKRRVVTFTDKKEYSFVVRTIQNDAAYKIGGYDPGNVTVESPPELIVMKLLALKEQGRVATYYSYFSDDYKKEEINRLNLKNGKAREQIADKWRTELSKATVRLSYRMDFAIDVTHFAVVRYKIENQGNGYVSQYLLRRRPGKNAWYVENMEDQVWLEGWFFQGKNKIVRKVEKYGVDTECFWSPDKKCKRAQ